MSEYEGCASCANLTMYESWQLCIYKEMKKTVLSSDKGPCDVR